MTFDLRNTDAASLLQGIEPETVDFWHIDPPWSYANFSSAMHGAAKAQYDGLSMDEIASHVQQTYQSAAPDSYCVLWCTFPKLQEWFACNTGEWRYITGGAWGKTNGLGVGFHVRGDAELWLLYAKGSPRPLTTQSNLILDRRIGHSEKPQEALRALVSMAAPEGGLVADLYAGASASMMIACRELGRRYIGAEIDPTRHAEALRRFALDRQSSMTLEARA